MRKMQKIVPIDFFTLMNYCAFSRAQYCEDSHCEIEIYCALTKEKRQLCDESICPLIYRREEEDGRDENSTEI